MGFLSGLLVYICLWWVIIFCVLPFGNAPDGPKISVQRKLVITSIISLGAWGVIYALIEIGLIDFVAIARTISEMSFNNDP